MPRLLSITAVQLVFNCVGGSATATSTCKNARSRCFLQVGRMVLDHVVDNFHNESEQIAFSPHNLVPGTSSGAGPT